MSVLRFLDKKFELVLLGIMLAIFTVLMFLNVLLRYLFGTSIVWGDEVCRYCLVASTFLSIPIWIRRRSGIRVDAVISYLPEPMRKGMDILVYVLLFVFFLYLFISGLDVYQNMAESGQVSAALRMPTKYLYAVVEFGFLLSMVRTVQVLVEQVRDFGKKAPSAAQDKEAAN